MERVNILKKYHKPGYKERKKFTSNIEREQLQDGHKKKGVCIDLINTLVLSQPGHDNS